MNRHAHDLSEAECEEGAALYLRAMEARNGAASTRLESWIGDDAGRRALIGQIAATWRHAGAIAGDATVRSWIDHAIGDVQAVRAPRNLMASYMAVAVAAALVLAVGMTGWTHYYGQAPAVTQEYASGIGEIREVSLADGTRIVLDAASRIAVDYSDDRRVVTLLTGQARFRVAKDAMRPFHVEVGLDDVQALGTDFNVGTTLSTMSVSLIEGSVLMSRLEERPSYFGLRDPVARVPMVTLKPGEQFQRKYDARARVQRFDPQIITAWQDGRLMFKDLPLADAAALANRYSTRPILIDPALPQIRLTAVINAHDGIAFARAAAAYIPGAEAHITPDRIVLRRAPKEFHNSDEDGLR